MPTPRLTRAAIFFHGLAVASMIGLPIVLIIGIFAPGLFGISFTSFEEFPANDWPLTIWAGIIVGLIPAVFSMRALNGMRQLFTLYRLGDPLSPQAGPLIKSIGTNLLLAAVLGVVVMPLHILLTTLSNPVGERAIYVGISTSDIGFILVAGLLLMIGWSMSEATKIAAENREFI